jgi:FtsZ-binding cell division protein ZapB
MNEAMKAAFESKNQIRGIHKNLDGSYIDAIQQAKWEGYQAALSQQPAQPTTDQHLANFIDPTDYLREVSGIAGAHRQLLNNWVSDAQKGIRSVMPLAPVAAQQSCEPVDGYIDIDGFDVPLRGIPNQSERCFEHSARKKVYLSPPDYEALRAENDRLKNEIKARSNGSKLFKFYINEEIEQLKEANKSMTQTLNYVERWANHHSVKPRMTAVEALSCIQHYPRILDITRGYADGKVPTTPNPFAECDALRAENEQLKEREQWIHDNATTSGGGHGFTVAFFVPVDHEDIFCGIDAAIKLEQK